MAPKIPVIAIVGRPNVGKSTFFNRVYGEQKAIVEDQPGVTRDRNYALVERFDVPFLLVDTGGFETDPEDEIGRQVVAQTVLAAEEADIVIAMFDGSTGCQEADRDVVELLRPYNKPVLYVVNKCDGQEQALRTADFYQLGVSELHDVSALNGRRVTVLMEQILKSLPNYTALLSSANARREREAEAEREAGHIAEQYVVEDDEFPDIVAEDELIEHDDPEGDFEPEFAPVFVPGESDQTEVEYERTHRLLPLDQSESRAEEQEDEQLWPEDADARHAPGTPAHIECIRVALVGRPNVGKSTLLNTLTGEQRAITSPIAGTTRDALDLKMRRDGQDYLIVDTAGLRKKARVEDETVERYSTLRSISAMSESDVAVIVIDGTAGPTEQDTKIMGLAHEQGLGIVIAVNKWDLVTKSHKTVHKFEENIRQAFKFAPYAEVVYVSALSGRRCPRIIEAVKAAAYSRMHRVPTAELNALLQKALRRSPPPPYRGRVIKMFYGVQVDVGPPRFALFFNYPRGLHFSFLRFIKNSIREKFEFSGTDIKLHIKKK
jgi:GTP-binding protein